MTIKGCSKACLWLFAFFLIAQLGNAQQPSKATSEASQANESSLDTLDTNTFAIADLLVRLKNEAGFSTEQSQAWIEGQVKSVIGYDAKDAPDVKSTIGVDLGDTKSISLPLDRNGRGAIAIGDQLLVVASRSELRTADELVKDFARLGVRQVVIRTHILRGPPEAMKELTVRWSHVEAASKIAESVTTGPIKPVSYEQEKQSTRTAQYLSRQKSPHADLPPPEGVTSATWTEATSIVERSTPVLYTLLTNDEYKGVLAQTVRVSEIKTLMAPKVTVFNGQIASVSDCVQRPFVTGIKAVKIGPKDKEIVEFVPNLKVYFDGTTLKMRPELFDGKSVRLNCKMDLCQIRDVETFEIPGVEGHRDFVVQIPEVASTQFSTCLDMPIGYALAINAFEKDKDGVRQAVVILCQCSVRDELN